MEKSFIFSWADMKKMRTNSPRISEPKGFTSTCFLAVVDWKISQSWVWAQNASKLFHHFDFFFFLEMVFTVELYFYGLTLNEPPYLLCIRGTIAQKSNEAALHPPSVVNLFEWGYASVMPCGDVRFSLLWRSNSLKHLFVQECVGLPHCANIFFSSQQILLVFIGYLINVSRALPNEENPAAQTNQKFLCSDFPQSTTGYNKKGVLWCLWDPKQADHFLPEVKPSCLPLSSCLTLFPSVYPAAEYSHICGFQLQTVPEMFHWSNGKL